MEKAASPRNKKRKVRYEMDDELITMNVMIAKKPSVLVVTGNG